MAYLTRLVPDLLSRCARQALGNPYQMHRDLMRAFPDAGPDVPGRSAFGVLYRIDSTTSSRARPAVLVQSWIEPNWSQLRCDPDGREWAVNIESKPFEPRTSQGDAASWLKSEPVLHFRLRANPSKRLRTESGSGKRVELRDLDDQIHWLVRKGEQHGFALREVRSAPPRDTPVYSVVEATDRRSIARKPATTGDARTITHAAVMFEGILRVTDPEAFADGLLGGIGPGKAFGLGLLSVARA